MRALFVGDSLVTSCANATFVWPLAMTPAHLRTHGVRADLYTRMLLLAFRRLCSQPVPQDVVEVIVSMAVDELVQFVPHHIV